MKMISSARNNGRTNEDWFHKYSCHSSRASEICQRPSIVTLVTHIHSNLYMKRWTRLVINAPRASSTGLAMWPSQNFSFSSSCWTCLENLHQVFLSSSCWDLWNQLYEESHLYLAIVASYYDILLTASPRLRSYSLSESLTRFKEYAYPYRCHARGGEWAALKSGEEGRLGGVSKANRAAQQRTALV